MRVPSRLYKDFATRRVVLEKVIERRLGPYSDPPPPGWRWDIRHAARDRIPEHLPNPGLKSGHLLSIPREYWQNGPPDGRMGKSGEVLGVTELFRRDRKRWVPEIHSGEMNIWRDPDYFFSDDSIIEKVDPDVTDAGGRTLHRLTKNLATESPVRACLYRRRNGEYLPWHNYIQRYAFTSLLDSDGNEQTTRTGDAIHWSYVDTTKREFVSYPRDGYTYLQFNQVAYREIGEVAAPSVLLDFNEKEYLGTSDGLDDQVFYSEYFPMDETLSLYVVNVSAGTWDQYSVVTEFTAPNQVIVDYDVGSFTFGVSTGVCPPPTVGRAIYLGYTAVPRIEYEEDGFGKTCRAVDADVNPLSQSLNRGFVVLTRADPDIASIVLSTTEPAYGSGSAFLESFGPVYVGADYAELLATVYSGGGGLLPNAEVYFWIDTSPSFGTLGGYETSFEAITDHNGIARSAYIPPTTPESIGAYVTSVTAGNRLTLPSDIHFHDPDDVYTYHVLKDDPWKGKVGADTSLGEIPWSSSPPNGRKVVFYKWNPTAINPITGHLGAYVPVRPASITNGYILNYTDSLDPPDPTPSATNLGAYWVVSDRYVNIRAMARSPRSGRIVLSNILTLRVEIPPYMKGSYITQALNEIPFGWRIRDDDYTVASALNGATYICINPVAGPYPIIDVIAGETWEPYTDYWPYGAYPTGGVSRPFGYLTFKFTIT